MTRRIAHLMVLLALLVLPVWAQNPVPNGTPMVSPQTEAGPDLFMPEAQPRSCYTQCLNEFYEPYCGGLPPGPEQQMCGAWVIEICRCQCGLYCP